MSSISVIIPTYNRRGTLKRCLDSVMEQRVKPEEIIVVDDGSTDGSADWIKNTYPDITLIVQSNRGVSAARNTGIRKANTDWIAFLDSDDCWMATKLEKQLAALAEAPEIKLCHTEERWINQGKERAVAAPYKKKGGWIFENCLPVCAISPSTAVIHRTVFEEVGLFDVNLPACEDYDLWLRITSRMPVLLVDEPLIEKHGGHEDQLSAQWGLDRWRIQALQKILGSGHLNVDQHRYVEEQLMAKCLIFAKGLEKHGKIEEANYYRSLAHG